MGVEFHGILLGLATGRQDHLAEPLLRLHRREEECDDVGHENEIAGLAAVAEDGDRRMAAQAIAFLEQADILTALDETVWDTSWILSDSSYLGRALHTLIGYVDQPTAMQLIVYAATLARANRLFITEVALDAEGEARFPPISPREWRETGRHTGERGPRDDADFAFVEYERRTDSSSPLFAARDVN